MPDTEVKHLFTFKRLPSNELKCILLLLYLPVGIILFILRTILGLSAIIIGYGLSNETTFLNKFINKIICLSLGIKITVENPEIKENVDVYISNSASIIDHLIVHNVTGSVSPGLKLQPSLFKGLGLHYFGNLSNLDEFKRKIRLLINEQKIPIHFQPEDKITNGKALLKFKTYPFTFSFKVQPICIKIERPFLNISTKTFASTYWMDILYFMFSPLTYYKLKFLPVLEKNNLNDEEFAEMVRQKIAKSLQIETSNYTANDLIEWEKRELIEQQQQRLSSVTRSVNLDSFQYSSDVIRMANQVKEVLPHVPLDAIYKDLVKTKNVDNTITNILEGRIRFIPEPILSKSTPQQTSSSSSSSSSSSTSRNSSFLSPSTSLSTPDKGFNTGVSTFGKSAGERSKSFQERKAQLISIARKRYLEKHNLQF